MIRNLAIAFVVSAAMIGTNWAFAQEPARPPATPDQGRGGGRGQTREGGRPDSFSPAPDPTVTLLRTREVQLELKIEEDKAQKIAAIDAEVRREMLRLTAEYNAKVNELNGKMNEIKKKAEGDALGLLSDAQHRRTEQLKLQKQGWLAFLANSQVREKLGLSRQQTDEMRKLQLTILRGAGAAGGPFGNATPQNANLTSQERARQRYEELDKRTAENLEKMLAILTPEQKAKWSEMTGEPFKFPSRGSATSGTRARPPEPAKPGTEKKDQ